MPSRSVSDSTRPNAPAAESWRWRRSESHCRCARFVRIRIGLGIGLPDRRAMLVRCLLLLLLLLKLLLLLVVGRVRSCVHVGMAGRRDQCYSPRGFSMYSTDRVTRSPDAQVFVAAPWIMHEREVLFVFGARSDSLRYELCGYEMCFFFSIPQHRDRTIGRFLSPYGS